MDQIEKPQKELHQIVAPAISELLIAIHKSKYPDSETWTTDEQVRYVKDEAKRILKDTVNHMVSKRATSNSLEAKIAALEREKAQLQKDLAEAKKMEDSHQKKVDVVLVNEYYEKVAGLLGKDETW
mmetsp:Transcript_10256/g.8807  ORF Transcript_10256/g.8807 Transcript_10256/m.8807 type:complete len:126 (+) Transcript_10256:84-461(+)